MRSPLKLSGEKITSALKMSDNLSEVIAFATNIGAGEHVAYPTYDGEYEVTPDTDSVTVLETKDKLMTDDVTVFKVPRWDVSNTDGTTVFIGKEQLIYGN